MGVETFRPPIEEYFGNKQESKKKADSFGDKVRSLNPREVSDEDLLKLMREANELSRLEFEDDDEYLKIKQELDKEKEKSPYYITKEMMALTEKFVRTTRGSLEMQKKVLDTELLDMRKSSERDDDLEIKTYSEEQEAKRSAGVKDRYRSLKDNLQLAQETGDSKLEENLTKEIEVERKTIIEQAERSISNSRERKKYFEVIPIRDDIYAVILPGLKMKGGGYVGYSVEFFDSKEKAKERIEKIRE